ncbi:MAG: LPXTG cell wall anchor domain-containing protein [Chloroflexi bacterium]|nr:MAG: LPXTG cell wall anchor domain-containing protein [Chloroflexota bacterium]TMF97369.1 MAG: LPXTG cell wall anchor domain-containing protein [Chloroflexota bacterium]
MAPLLAILGAIMAILLAALVLRRRTRRHKSGERN